VNFSQQVETSHGHCANRVYQEALRHLGAKGHDYGHGHKSNIAILVCAILSEISFFLPRFRSDSRRWQIRPLCWIAEPMRRFRDFDWS